MAFGGTGGYVHLWATAAAPRVNIMSQQLDFPTVPSKPSVVWEQEPFAMPFPYGASQVSSPASFFYCLHRLGMAGHVLQIMCRELWCITGDL